MTDSKRFLMTDKTLSNLSEYTKDRNRKCEKRYEKQELEKGKVIEHLNNWNPTRGFKKHAS